MITLLNRCWLIVPTKQVVAAYQRAEFLDARRDLMERWSAVVCGEVAAG